MWQYYDYAYTISGVNVNPCLKSRDEGGERRVIFYGIVEFLFYVNEVYKILKDIIHPCMKSRD